MHTPNSFIPGIGANIDVYTVVLQPDGKIIIGGLFTSYIGTTRNHIARLNTDCSLDNSFDPGTGANNNVYTAALQPDGKIIIGGSFTTYNGTTRNCIARLNADGSLDNTFYPGSGADNSVKTITLQPDGKIIIGGHFTLYNGTTRNSIARLNADGSLDNSFDPGTGANNNVYTTLRQPDGKIIIGGLFTSYGNTGRNRIARILNCYLANGTDVQTACNSFTWIDGNTYTSDNNTATHNIIGGAANGCDSLVTLNLDITVADTLVTVTGNTLTANASGASYQWLDCANSYTQISGETNQNFIPSANGNYAVEVFQNGCTDTSVCINFVIMGNNENTDVNSLKVYPNPLTDISYLEFNGNNSLIKSVRIFNILGTQVYYSEPGGKKKAELKRNDFSSGLFIYELETMDGDFYSGKLSVE